MDIIVISETDEDWNKIWQRLDRAKQWSVDQKWFQKTLYLPCLPEIAEFWLENIYVHSMRGIAGIYIYSSFD